MEWNRSATAAAWSVRHLSTPIFRGSLHCAPLACSCAGNVANTLCIVLLLVMQGATGKQVTEQQVSAGLAVG